MSDAVKKIEDVTETTRFAPETPRVLRAAELTPSSLTEDGRITFVLATPTPVKRWYRDLDTYERFQADEILPVETAVLMDESKRSVPLLNCHQSYDSRHVVGVVTKMARENGQIVCEAMLSKRDAVKDIVEGIREGVLRNFSVGASEVEMELAVDATTGAKTMRAKRWLIDEASVVPVPADGTAQIRSASDIVTDWRRTKQTEETEMTKEEIAALVTETVRSALAAQTPSETDEAKATREAAEAAARAAPKTTERSAEETAQVTLLRSQATSYGVEATFDAMASTGASVAELRGVLLQGMRSKAHPGEIEGFSGGDTQRSSGDEKLMRFADTATAKAEAAARGR